MGNKPSKTSEQAADLCTECQDLQIPNSEEMLQLKQSCVTLDINAETITYQKGHHPSEPPAPSDETTLNSQEIDSKFPISVEASEGMEVTQDHSSQLPHQDNTEETAEEEPIIIVSNQNELSTAGTQTESGCTTKDANTQTDENFIATNLVQFSLNTLSEFTKVDQNSSLLQFVSQNRQKIQTLVDSLQILLSNTDVASSPEKETEQEDDHTRPTESTPIIEVEQTTTDTLESSGSPEVDTDSPNEEPESPTESEEFNRTSSQDFTTIPSTSSDTKKEVKFIEKETDSQEMIRFRALEIAYQEAIKPTTSDWQPSMMSVPTSELPSFPIKKSLWKRFKKGISKPFRMFKK